MERTLSPETELSIAEQEWRLAFDAAPHGIALSELDGTIVHVNRSLCTILGYLPEELQGLTFTEITHPDDLPRDFANRDNLLSGALQRYTVEKRYRHRTGAWVWVTRSVGVVRDPHTNAPLRYVVTIEDISERIAAAEAAARAIARQRAIIAAQSAIAEMQLDKQSLRDEMCIRAMSLTRAGGAVVELLEDGELVCRAAVGQLELHLGSRLTADGSIAQLCIEDGIGQICPDTETDPRVRREVARTLGIRSVLVVPLRIGDAVVGVLKVVSPQSHKFALDDLRALEVLAAPFGAALRNADHLAASAAQAHTDALTGVTNRHGALQALRRSLAKGEHTGVRTAVLFVDLDGFKLVNDLRGHRVGDAVLVAVAERIRQVIRRADTVARFGGDEFVVIAENVPTDEEADSLADRLVAEICRPYALAGEPPASIGASVGVAIADGRASLTDALDAADRAMYAAKARGGGYLRVQVS